MHNIDETITSSTILRKKTDCINSGSWAKTPITKILDILTDDPKITHFFNSLCNVYIRLAPSNYQVKELKLW